MAEDSCLDIRSGGPRDLACWKRSICPFSHPTWDRTCNGRGTKPNRSTGFASIPNSRSFLYSRPCGVRCSHGWNSANRTFPRCGSSLPVALLWCLEVAKLRKLLARHKRALLSRNEAISRIRSSGTAPERVVRQLLCQAGIKYRSNGRDLPGKPDQEVRDIRARMLLAFA
jgi:hypothetical protein